MSAEIIAIIASAVGIVLSMGALVLCLFLYSNDKMDKFSEKWNEESKDFHGRLIAIEIDFKNFMKREEEKRTAGLLKL